MNLHFEFKIYRGTARWAEGAGTEQENCTGLVVVGGVGSQTSELHSVEKRRGVIDSTGASRWNLICKHDDRLHQLRSQPYESHALQIS